ncbi:MAG TPA: MarR family winged helix-turn-helix transcriptional regulator [Candidatus Dormibacteraeota bacterium]|nr:MarR family winged helix-turn-helix transcriptional regulator [Candidatus Dormibacteraeota bacterium]
MPPASADVSMLFDLFVVSQRVRRLLQEALAESPLRADEYAVYSLLFEAGPMTATGMSRGLGMPLSTVLDYLRGMEVRGHLGRRRHPRDGRAQHLSLTIAGVAAHRRTNAAWEVMREDLEAALEVPVADVRRALRALDEAARTALERVDGRIAAG